eukprot:COSAG05_NODE_3330_length_2146_cov_39.440535_5_plen_124_part_00
MTSLDDHQQHYIAHSSRWMGGWAQAHLVDIVGESVQDPPRRRRVKERHREAQNVPQQPRVDRRRRLDYHIRPLERTWGRVLLVNYNPLGCPMSMLGGSRIDTGEGGDDARPRTSSIEPRVMQP